MCLSGNGVYSTVLCVHTEFKSEDAEPVESEERETNTIFVQVEAKFNINRVIAKKRSRLKISVRRI